MKNIFPILHRGPPWANSFFPVYQTLLLPVHLATSNPLNPPTEVILVQIDLSPLYPLVILVQSPLIPIDTIVLLVQWLLELSEKQWDAGFAVRKEEAVNH